MRLRARAFLLLASTLVALVPACAEEAKKGVLQDADLEPVEGVTDAFNRNELVELAAFVDSRAFEAAAIQKFLHRTPYGRASFLETYQSNGARASDAIALAARTHQINPLALLVFAQATQGLVGEKQYPFPPERVEYVFNCGCLEPKNCVPQLAGFDRQVDCLARALRAALEQIVANGVTASGWGPEKTSATFDGYRVTPTDGATAVLYDRVPIVAEEEAGGTWALWNIWNLYAKQMDYVGPVGGSGTGRWIGDPCVSDAACGYDKGLCATNYQGGMCTARCESECPTRADAPEAFCAAFSQGGFCLPRCTLGTPTACREGYKCTLVQRQGALTPEDAQAVCFPVAQ